MIIIITIMLVTKKLLNIIIYKVYSACCSSVTLHNTCIVV